MLNDEEKENVEIFKNDIEMYFKMFCEEEHVEDIRKEPQAIFYAALIYTQRHAFPDRSILKLHRKYEPYNNNSRPYFNNSSCGVYNYDYLLELADYYIYLCYKYDKICTITGFSKLTGIKESIIFEWGSDSGKSGKLSTTPSALLEKLRGEYENSGEGRLWSGKNPVGHLAALNRRFGWNLPGVSRETSQRQTLTAEDIRRQLQNTADSPLLSDNSSQNKP